MNSLMHQFDGAGFKALVFEYASFRGIDHAAKSLEGLLDLMTQPPDLHRRAVIVAHSMGGLVARAFVLLGGGARYVKRVITLGTPHGGTLKKARFAHYFASWGEHLSGLNPEGFAPSCASALQLIGADTPNRLLDRLRDAPAPAFPVTFCTISGGYGRLEFGTNSVQNYFANLWLQRHLSMPNDGLVEDSSSDLSNWSDSTVLPTCTHINTYVEFPFTNHSYLIENQTVQLLAIQFARSS